MADGHQPCDLESHQRWERPGTISAGTFTSRATRYADVQFVWSHAGGTLLGLVGRFLGAEAANPTRTPERNARLHHLKRFFYDTATSGNRIQMEALKSLVGPSQIVFGSDFPFVPIGAGTQGLEGSGFTPEELRAIYRDNALRLLAKKGQRGQITRSIRAGRSLMRSGRRCR